MSQVKPVGKTIVASSARTTSSNSGNLKNATGSLPLTPHEITLILDATVASGNLDVCLQHSPDGGTTWFEHSRFAQVTTASTRRLNLRNFLKRGDAADEQAVATTGGADANNGMLFEDHRINWEISGASPTFTFAVYAGLRQSNED